MPRYRVTLPDGRTTIVESDTKLAPDEIKARAHPQLSAPADAAPAAPVAAPSPAAPPERGNAFGRFLKGAWQGFDPITPLVKTVAGFPEQVRGQIEQIRHPVDAPPMSTRDLARTVLREGMLRGFGPFANASAADAGEQIAEGNIAGGLGTATGAIAQAALPKILPHVGGGVSRVGRGVEFLGSKTKPWSAHGGLMALASGRPGLAAMAAAPWVTEQAGVGLQRLGKALTPAVKPPAVFGPEPAPAGMRAPAPRAFRSSEVPGSSYREGPGTGLAPTPAGDLASPSAPASAPSLAALAERMQGALPEGAIDAEFSEVPTPRVAGTAPARGMLPPHPDAVAPVPEHLQLGPARTHFMGEGERGSIIDSISGPPQGPGTSIEWPAGESDIGRQVTNAEGSTVAAPPADSLARLQAEMEAQRGPAAGPGGEVDLTPFLDEIDAAPAAAPYDFGDVSEWAPQAPGMAVSTDPIHALMASPSFRRLQAASAR